MLLKREGRPGPGIKVVGSILLLVTIAAMLGGCAWLFNKPPVAECSATPTSGEAPLEVTFDASESYDPDGDEISYEWDFGDGNVAEGETVQHGFGSPGSYTVRLLVTDSRGKFDKSSKFISVSQPPDETTEEQTFHAQDGIEYDSGAGLEVSIPPDPSGGQRRLVVTENPTPQQPEGDFIELQSVYSITLAQGSSPQEIVSKNVFQDSSLVKLTFDIPSGVDPGSAMIVEWTDDGWTLAENETGLPGGSVSADGHCVSVTRKRLSSFSLASIGETVLHALDSIPEPPPKPPEARILNKERDNRENWVVTVELFSPYYWRTLGGMHYRIDVESSDMLAVDKNGEYLSPGIKHNVVITFPAEGGDAEVILRKGLPSLPPAALDWAARLGVGKDDIDDILSAFDLLVETYERYPEGAWEFKDLLWLVKEILIDSLWHLAGSKVKFFANLVPVSVDITTHILGSWDPGFCPVHEGLSCLDPSFPINIEREKFASTSALFPPEDVTLPASQAKKTQTLQFEYAVELKDYDYFFTAIITPGAGTYHREFRPLFDQSGRYTGELEYTAPDVGKTQTFTIQGQMSPTAEGQSNTDSETVIFKVTAGKEDSSGNYDRDAACSYAQKYYKKVCSDGYFFKNSSTPAPLGAGTPVPEASGVDCAHFVSCCIGNEKHERGGGLEVPHNYSYEVYGYVSAPKLVSWLLDSRYHRGTEKTSITELAPGDVIAYNTDKDTEIEHVAVYLGDNKVAAHSQSWGPDDGDWHLTYSSGFTLIHIGGSATPSQTPDPPTPTSPGSSSQPGPEIEDLTPTFQWDGAPGADRYGLYISEFPYGTSHLVYTNNDIPGSRTSFDLPGGVLEHEVRYRWNMRTHNSAGSSDFSNTLYFQIAQPVVLDRVVISGASEVDEDSSAQYTCTAHFSDGSSSNVTNSASWSENSSYTTISSSGRLSVGSLSSDKTCTVTASYTYNGVTKSESKSVRLNYVPTPKTLTSVTISGQDQVDEGKTAQYTCTAHFSDGSSSNVTNSASWSVNPATYATISSAGLLDVGDLSSDKTCTVGASYTYNGVTKSASKSVTLNNTTQPNQPPTCSLSASPRSGTAPLTVTFSMSASDPDPDGSISRWLLNPGDGSSYSGSGSPPSTKSHTYQTSGNYTAILMVSDNDDATASDTVTISGDPTNRPPTCSLSANPRSGRAPLTVTFSMSASDPDGVVSPWVLNPGDGSPSYSGNGSPPSTKTHTYQTSGNYTAILMVGDNDDATASDTVTIVVSPSDVALTLYVHEGSTSGPNLSGVQVQGYDGSGSSFNQTTNSSGYVQITGAPGSWHFTASKSGYQSKTWDQSITSTTAKHAYLQPLPPQPPTCSLSASPRSGTAPLTVTFSMSASDPDGSISAWVLNPDDGSPNYSGNGSPPSTKTHTYQTSGNYTAILMVSDNDDATASDTETISVGSSNQPPTCSLSANPRSGRAPLTVTFSMSASDPDGVVSPWVLNPGDGSSYSGNGSPPSTKTHTYQTSGNYTAILMVGDNDDATASDIETIIVTPSSELQIGDRVRVTTNLNVRTGPSTSHPEITDPDYPGYAPAGSLGTVVDGPISADGYIWWKIQYDLGFTGWSVENGLERI